MANSYRELEIYQKSLEFFYRVHALSLKLPKHELYELGSQIRRSSSAIGANIVEGYGRKRYRADFIKFLVYAHSSNDETVSHLEKLNHLYPEFEGEFSGLKQDYEDLGRKIFSFIRYVESSWRS